ncbi:MAG: ATP-binding protein [Ignavibacteria bacterium]|jgi:signal transduction histidine kinase/CheY-like chemotaxis protein|nr:ATP-binding protein [Ignavibacteria bacterium]
MAAFKPEKIINLLSESNLQGIAIYSSDKFLYSNSKTLEILELTYDKFISLDLNGFRDRILPEDMAEHRYFFDLFGTSKNIDSKIAFRYKGKHTHKWVEMYAKSSVFDGKRYIILILSDITEHKIFEELISDKDFKYKNFIEKTSEGISLMEFEKPIDTTLPVEKQIELMYKYGIISECNLALAGMYGFGSVNELLGKRLIELHGGTDNPKNIDAFEDLVKSGYNVANVETEEFDTGGKRKYFLNNSVGILKNNLLYGIWGAQIDITLRKTSERLITAAYRISEAVHLSRDVNSLYETMHGVINNFMHAENFYIAIFDKQKDVITFPYFRDEFDGIAKDRKPGKGITEYVLKTGAPLLATHEIINEMKEKGEILPFGTTAIDWLGVPLKVGEDTIGVLAVQSYDENIRYTSDDVNVLEFVSDQIAMAIERKRAEEALKHSESKNRAILSSIPDLMFILTKEGDFIDYHAKNPEHLYVKPEEFIGKNIKDVFEEPLFLLFEKTMKNALVSSTVEICEYPLLLKEETKHYEARMISYEAGNVLVMIRDISDRIKIMEELIIAKDKAEEMNKIKSNFLSNMSHELRTPLHGILGFSQMLEEEIDNTELRKMASTIHTSGKRLLETLNLLLSFSKTEAKKIEINYSEININNLIRETIVFFKAYAESKNLKLEFYDNQNNINAVLDERLLRDILNNLINNAVKFTDKGGVIVELAVHNNDIIIKVTDSGIGIPENKYGLIFEEFRQESEGLNRNFEGTGLGLTLTKKYTELMHGSIKVESTVGMGSVFTVTLPLKPHFKTKDNSSSTGKNKDTKIISAPAHKRNILLVENDKVSTMLIKTYLSKNYNIDSVSKGSEALEITAQKRYDIILMDINLGEGLTGIETTQLIRNLDNYRDVPIVAVTAFALESDKEEFLRHGCTHYISKPFEQKELMALLNDVFSGNN